VKAAAAAQNIKLLEERTFHQCAEYETNRCQSMKEPLNEMLLPALTVQQ